MLSPINFENLTGKSQLYQTNCIHWFTFKINRSFVLILSNIDLLIFPELLLAGLISRHFGLFSKFFCDLLEK